MQPEGHHPDYSFITNPTQASKRNLFDGGDKKQRLLIVLIGGLLLVLGIVMLFSFILGGSGSNNDRLVGLAQQQTELVRVAGLAENDAVSDDAKNLAGNVVLVMSSSQTQTIELLAEQGQKVKPKDLALKQNAQTDEALTAAKQANRFDEVFIATLQSELTAYTQELTDFYNQTDSQTEKDTLQSLYSQSKALLATNP